MFDTAAIFRTAHARAKAEVSAHRYIAYRVAFARALRVAWDAAKRAVVEAARPVADRIRIIENEIYAEECRSFMDHGLVARLRKQLTELRAAA